MKKPEHLFDPHKLLITAALCGGALYALYPRHETPLFMDESEKKLKVFLSSPMYTEYARMSTEPNASPEQLVSLSNKLTDKNLWEESTHLLEHLPKNTTPSLRQQADWLLLNNYLNAYYAATSSSLKEESEIQSTRNKLINQLGVLSTYQKWSPPKQQLLAKYYSDFGLHLNASHQYAQLALVDPGKKIEWLEKSADAAKVVRAWDDVEQRMAQLQTERSGAINEYTCSWLESLVNSGKKQKAIDYIVNNIINSTTELEKNTPELKKIAALSTQLGKPDLTLTLYQKLALTDPESSQTWNEKAAYWASAAGLYDVAADHLAEAYEESSDPVERLSLQYKSIDVWSEAGQPVKTASLLTPLLDNPELSSSLIKQSVNSAMLAEKQGKNQLADELWEKILANSNEFKLWEHVALWQASRRKYSSALKTWAAIEKKFGQNNQTTLMKIQLYWESRQYARASDLVKKSGKKIIKSANRYQRSILMELKKIKRSGQQLATR